MNEIWEQLDAVRTGEWVKGDPFGSGRACLLVRVDEDDVETLSDKAQKMLADVLVEQYQWLASPVCWNDAPERTQEEVERILEKAAIRLDEQEGLA